MYMGGMQATFWPRYAPSRTLLPPGTMRMPFSGPMRCIGYVSLSRKLSVPTDISVLNWEKLARENLIAYSKTSYPEYHEELGAIFKMVGAKMRIAEEHNGVTSLIAAVEAGRG